MALARSKWPSPFTITPYGNSTHTVECMLSRVILSLTYEPCRLINPPQEWRTTFGRTREQYKNPSQNS